MSREFWSSDAGLSNKERIKAAPKALTWPEGFLEMLKDYPGLDALLGGVL